MREIWFGFLIELFLISLIRPFLSSFEGVAISAVIIHVIFSAIVLASSKYKDKSILIVAFLLRVIVLGWDRYAKFIRGLPHSGMDSEAFYLESLLISENISIINTGIRFRGGVYSQLNGILFYLIGPQRLIGQYVNVLLGLSTVFVLYKILLLLDIAPRVRKNVVFLAALFPTSLIMSAIFLREAFPTFFVAASLYFFIKWYKKTEFSSMMLSIVMLGIASIFHSGVIGIFIGHAFAFLFYKKESNSFKFYRRTILYFIILSMIIFFGFTTIDDYIFGKFREIRTFEDIDEIILTANKKLGGSVYLENLTINNPVQLVVFSPLKGIFFLISPLPINWRGFLDIFTFFTDSLLYLLVILYYLRYRFKKHDKKSLATITALMIIGATIIFGIGVNNAGTALRHRQKLVPLFLLLLGLIRDHKIKIQSLVHNNIVYDKKNGITK